MALHNATQATGLIVFEDDRTRRTTEPERVIQLAHDCFTPKQMALRINYYSERALLKKPLFTLAAKEWSEMIGEPQAEKYSTKMLRESEIWTTTAPIGKLETVLCWNQDTGAVLAIVRNGANEPLSEALNESDLVARHHGEQLELAQVLKWHCHYRIENQRVLEV